MAKTNIGWTDNSWNPYDWHCNKVSPGCKYCYAEALNNQYKRGVFAGAPNWRENAVKELRTFKPGETVFVCTMSDTFHEGVPQAWIHRIFALARQYPHLIFLLLTKRIERAAYLAPYLDWGPNIWIGTSVENADYLWRLDYLRGITQAAGRFVSFEPLLGSVGKPNLHNIQWAIVGGESGSKRRPFDKAWAADILRACDTTQFFFKQGSGFKPGQDRVLWNNTWSLIPPQFVQWKAQYQGVS
jgi:protein gp37